MLYGADAVPLSASSNVIVGRDLEFFPAMGGGLAGAQNNMLVVGQNPNALFLVALDDQPRDGDPTKSLRVVRSAVVGSALTASQPASWAANRSRSYRASTRARSTSST